MEASHLDPRGGAEKERKSQSVVLRGARTQSQAPEVGFVKLIHGKYG